jgi:pimeloyl-ACP methyl ester carboxylesterase
VSQKQATECTVGVGSRVLAVDISGDPAGEPVFLLHGTPGSKSGPRPRDSVLYRLGVRLISYDRPGYGGSQRHEKRIVADAATDVAAIADHLGLRRFAVVGRSGGGPHALACAALLPKLVTRAAVLVGIAPQSENLEDWVDGMTSANVRDHIEADRDFAKLVERLRLRADRTLADPESFLRALREQMTGPDQRVVDDVVMQKLLTESYIEALRDGPYGWIDDVYAFSENWGFDVESIDRPVLLWHGVDDNFSPVGHSRWLAAKLPRAEKRFKTDSAHFGAMGVLPEVLAWLMEADGETPATHEPRRVPARSGGR